MENKFIKGIIAGIVAGVIKDIPNAIVHHIPRLNEITLWDYAGAIALGRLPKGFPEHFYAVFLEILFSIFVGLIFVNLPFLNKYQHAKLKGVFFGAMIWFLIRAAVFAFQIRILLWESLGTSVTNLFVSMFYGCVLVCTIRFLDQRMKL